MANIPEFISVLRRIRDEIYPEVEEMYENTGTLKSEAELSKNAAAASAAASASSAGVATTRANEIKNVSAQANTLPSGSLATVSYNSTDGKFTFGLPVGAKGDKGESYTINATGTTAGRTAYDTQSVGFSYLDITLSIVYFKLSTTSGDWSTGTSFGKGEDGADGENGTGITSIAFYSTTSDNGLASQPGGIDTYRITLSNSNTYDISLTNGSDLNINGYGDKIIPKDDDEFAIADSDSYFNVKKLSIKNLKASLNSGFKNLIVNGKKVVNQSGLTTTDNAYNYDNHYKVGNNWFMFIDEKNIVSGEHYTLSWDGVATAGYYIGTAGALTINAQTFTPIANGESITPTITSSQILWIKFASDASGSTYNKVQFEPGTALTPYEQRLYELERSLVQSCYSRTSIYFSNDVTAGNAYGGITMLPVDMIKTPILTLINQVNANGTFGTIGINNSADYAIRGVNFYAVASSTTNGAVYKASIIADARPY